MEFNKQLYSERNGHLVKRLKELKSEYSEIEIKLKELNEKQANLLSFLKDKDAFKKYHQYQNQIIKIEAEISLLESNLTKLNEIDSLNSEVKKMKNESEEIKDEIKKEVNEEKNKTFYDIRIIFNQIIKDIVNLPAIPSIKINQSGNVEFEADIQDVNQKEITAKGKGTTYRKILCAAFDLSVLIHYSKMSFFKFVYHDGLLEGLDNRKKINFINTIKTICTENNLQYILTSIEDDLPRDAAGKIIAIDEKEIALVLNDKGDEGRLFKQSY